MDSLWLIILILSFLIFIVLLTPVINNENNLVKSELITDIHEDYLSSIKGEKEVRLVQKYSHDGLKYLCVHNGKMPKFQILFENDPNRATIFKYHRNNPDFLFDNGYTERLRLNKHHAREIKFLEGEGYILQLEYLDENEVIVSLIDPDVCVSTGHENYISNNGTVSEDSSVRKHKDLDIRINLKAIN